MWLFIAMLIHIIDYVKSIFSANDGDYLPLWSASGIEVRWIDWLAIHAPLGRFIKE